MRVVLLCCEDVSHGLGVSEFDLFRSEDVCYYLGEECPASSVMLLQRYDQVDVSALREKIKKYRSLAVNGF